MILYQNPVQYYTCIYIYNGDILLSAVTYNQIKKNLLVTDQLLGITGKSFIFPRNRFNRITY